jgi:hypothetical protein
MCLFFVAPTDKIASDRGEIGLHGFQLGSVMQMRGSRTWGDSFLYFLLSNLVVLHLCGSAV